MGAPSSSSTTTLEEGGGELTSHVEHKAPEQAAQFMRTAATGELPGGMLEVPTSAEVAGAAAVFTRMQTVGSRPGSEGSKGGSGSSRNSGIMVEEEPSTWLKDYGGKGDDVAMY